MVITDMEMPEMTGIKLAKAIKKENEKIPVILLSFVGDEAKKKHPGLFISVLTKPVKQLNLCKAIHTALGGSETEQKDKAKKRFQMILQRTIRCGF
ncbi:response regulator [Cohnella faecalis]|uniref:Response regulator n=1 Tax=Cohnella faecalis TaxID=2315694 RepID=A0A398CKG4_9BACL|nr:response regulator [Cohnella faecalis]RIE00171.1 response regulator [Cohnella faecalis]